MGDEIKVSGNSVFKVMENTETKNANQIIKENAQKIIASAPNTVAVKNLKENGYEILKVIDKKTGKEYPPNFWSAGSEKNDFVIKGFDKMPNVEIIARKDGEVINLQKSNVNATEGYLMSPNAIRFNEVTATPEGQKGLVYVRSTLSEDKQLEFDRARNSKNPNELYNFMKDNNLLDSFNKWLQQELQRSNKDGAGFATPAQLQNAKIAGDITFAQGNANQEDVQKREENAGKKS